MHKRNILILPFCILCMLLPCTAKSQKSLWIDPDETPESLDAKPKKKDQKIAPKNFVKATVLVAPVLAMALAAATPQQKSHFPKDTKDGPLPLTKKRGQAHSPETVHLFIKAAICDNPEIVQELIDKNSTLKEVCLCQKTALHWAAWGNSPSAIKLLINKKGIDLNREDPTGWTPLHCAARGGLIEVAKLFLDKHANTKAKDKYGRTALHLAALQDSKEVVKMLTEKNKKLVAAVDAQGKTALHYAAEYGSHKVVPWLLKKMEIKRKDNRGWTALHWAARYGNKEIGRLLISADRSLVKIVDKKGRTAAVIAQRNGHQETVSLFSGN